MKDTTYFIKKKHLFFIKSIIMEDNAEKLGEGTHGSVYVLDDERVVKKTKIVDRRTYGTYMSDGLVTELAAVERVVNTCCRHIVGVHGWKCTKEKGVVYSELTLERMTPLDALPREQLASCARTYIRHLFEALSDLHGEDIAHCDLKLDNLMWRWREDEISVIDFGLAKLDSGVKPSEKAEFTFDYRSPEAYLSARNIDLKKADVWSAGVCAASMMFGRGKRSVFYYKMYDLKWRKSLDLILHSLGAILPAVGSSSLTARYHTYQERLLSLSHMAAKPKSKPGYLLRKIASLVSEDAADFIKKVMDVDPRSRLTADQALAHPYLAGGNGDCSIHPPRTSPFPILDPERGTPIDASVINEIVAACLQSKLCPETAFKTLDVISAMPAEDARDPKTVAAAVAIAASIGERRLVNVTDLFETMAPWVKQGELCSQVCKVMKYPGVVSLLAAPSVLQMARVLDQKISGTKEDPVVSKLLGRYVEKGGLRPTAMDIIECVKN